MSESNQPYRVLARKYRPQNFSELIGQDAMVTTLGNAIKRGRLAHAFLLTGVRGVGKTSTARLIAKALNCIGPDGQGGPTISPCGVCEPCLAIAEGRHIDVVEMDAASHTGVDDVREIIEAVRYAAVSARYKVYIIDEVHMLSKNAFNALLKTLEEPPAHVKFLFATTEVNKVPVTVLSRCQRFDLRRISADMLAAHFAMVVDKEGVQAEPEALALVARAAEGSARDGLSILDQAIAHADMDGHGVTAAQVREMLGLSDRGAVRRLFGQILSGDSQATLKGLRDQHDLGVEPVAILRALLETVHGTTLAKVGGNEDPALSVEEREALADWASKLSFAALHRLWQLLLKGHDEVVRASMPIEAAEMAILRVIHASQLPDPGELARKIAGGEPIPMPMPAAAASAPAPAPAPAPAVAHEPVAPVAPPAQDFAPVQDMAPEPAYFDAPEDMTSFAPEQAAPAPEPAAPAPVLPASFAEMIDMLMHNGRAHMAQQLHDYIGLIRYAPPDLKIRPTKPMASEFNRDLAVALKAITGVTWEVASPDEEAEPTLLEQEHMRERAARDAIMATPLVQAVLKEFPDAELLEYKQAAQG
ncbi:DNA polymerase III subunit gamma/tau [Sphingomonas sp. C3-2]|uniref:DNA polymerase III subunit gamma/tau n=1 Tax=Sphingomonas sp. C3-2 TaxID=3062169 RepID=UPI00294B757C|nr:DNA polymerase III subunit gamma/tau [Sphingomonas sp. C3-2]WOK36653.1 DNA polymerase III subunit gamma/tau [Sphingomonas sp. C3-2]